MSTAQEIEAAIPTMSREELTKLKKLVDNVLFANNQGASLLPKPALSSSHAATCAELAERWDSIPRLPADDVEAFAHDVELARASLSTPTSRWD